MIGFFRRSKAFCFLVLFTMIFQIVGTQSAYALTSGPSQPEMQAFQPAGTTDMVDLFTGDFSYNIPLFELPGPNGGYPFNLSYQSGIGMDQEASWVGLGWSLQPGAITRQMRGLPDEFNGDIIKTKMSINPNVTVGLGAGASVELFGAAAELGIGFSVYQNNYSGMGYSIDASLGFDKTVKGMTGGLSLGLSLDSKEGVGVNPSLNLGGKIGQFGLGAGYNSKQGLTNISMQASKKDGEAAKYDDDKRSWGSSVASSASISFAHSGYTPQISMPMKSLNLSANFKAGAAWWGIFGAPYVNGFYSEQRLANDNKWVQSKAYGYMNYQYAGETDILDFNREKDGIVSKESPNLALPSLTYDIYSVTGQGIGMMYRPMRNDYGVVYDQKMESVSNAVGVGVDVGPASSHIGVNLNVNHSKSTSGKWTVNNTMLNLASFQKKKNDDLYEPWHFQVHGEPTSHSAQKLKNIGGDKAVRLALTNENADPWFTNSLQYKDIETGTYSNTPSPNNATNNRDRSPRTNAVHSITNGELLNETNEEMINHFKVRYLDHNGVEQDFVRSSAANESHHFAGHTALTAEGLRYIYAIPAYNNYQEEVVFSTSKLVNEGRTDVNASGDDPGFEVPGTNKFLKRTELPKYAHSHLLTSILGPDYVDVTNNGVTEDDLGYWVKFTYQKTTTELAPYKWRDPYTQAHFQEGWKSDPRDDKGSFVYGEKELWYLARAETKSHIAEFTIEAREDGRGVVSKLQDEAPVKGGAVHRLNAIKLYTRIAGPSNPIKVTRFEYNYSLCPGIENSATGGGKLTLKKIWFEYGKSTRGSLNPYTFSYNNESNNPIGYDINAYDRWGNYKQYPDGQKLFNQDFPYAEQDPSKKAAIDANASAWSIKEIKLPSGGKILVDYESDDYAYVQNKTAMQMTPVVDSYTDPLNALSNTIELNKSQADYLKVRFKLETPLPGDISTAEQAEQIRKYIDTDTWQLYFKLLMNLRSPSEGVEEYIMGYADINKEAAMGLEKGPSGEFIYGFFHLKGEDGGSAGIGVHPFSMRAWQHLRTNQPELANSGRKLEQTDDQAKRINQIKSLSSVGAQIKQLFSGFNDYCYNHDWGVTLNSEKSWIRLNTPDGIKYGGGLRVKQITMNDQWSQDEEGIYGQVYEYTTQKGNRLISSGVAAYEPIIGGDENALHYAKEYVESQRMRSDNNLFFEYPVNESYYPGPQVGYSEVTVMSLAAAALSGRNTFNTKLSDNEELFPTGTDTNYGTTGKMVHEFYTAKEYPVITDETDKLNKQFKLSVPILFLGNVSVNKLTATQGYSIITNDMHGKQKKVSNYRQSRSGVFEEDPISWVQYKYSSTEEIRDGKRVSVLQNSFKVNDDGTLSSGTGVEVADIAQEVEFFHDMREFEDIAWGGGARYNTDIVYVPILFAILPLPVPTVWPSVTNSTTRLRTAVSNKVIFRAGVLVEVEAFDGGSIAKTTNIKWDAITGSPVLTSVNNNFDDRVYSYTIPAYTKYQGMGAAFRNIGLNFIAKNVLADPYKDHVFRFDPPHNVMEELFRGDELLLYNIDSQFENPIAKAVYLGRSDNGHLFFSEEQLNSTSYECKIVRSGYRNQLTVAASTITALDDPSDKGADVVYTKTISVPK